MERCTAADQGQLRKVIPRPPQRFCLAAGEPQGDWNFAIKNARSISCRLHLATKTKGCKTARSDRKKCSEDGSGVTLSTRSLSWTASVAGKPSIVPLVLAPRPPLDPK